MSTMYIPLAIMYSFWKVAFDALEILTRSKKIMSPGLNFFVWANLFECSLWCAILLLFISFIISKFYPKPVC